MLVKKIQKKFCSVLNNSKNFFKNSKRKNLFFNSSVLNHPKTCDSRIFFLNSSVLNYPETCVSNFFFLIKNNSSIFNYSNF